jgi:hypothetical protein
MAARDKMYEPSSFYELIVDDRLNVVDRPKLADQQLPPRQV